MIIPVSFWHKEISGATNEAPTASNISLFNSSYEIGDFVGVSYNYLDNESDLEDASALGTFVNESGESWMFWNDFTQQCHDNGSGTILMIMISTYTGDPMAELYGIIKLEYNDSFEIAELSNAAHTFNSNFMCVGLKAKNGIYLLPSWTAGRHVAMMIFPAAQTGTARDRIFSDDNAVFIDSPNTPPTATNVEAYADDVFLQSGETVETSQVITGDYTFNDVDGDSEHPTGTTEKIYVDTGDGNFDLTLRSDTGEYQISPLDLGLYIVYQVTPMDEHGLLGLPYYSGWHRVVSNI